MAEAANSIVSLQNWPQARFVAAAGNCVAKKYCLLLGCHTDSILLRKIWEQGRNSYTVYANHPHPRKTVGFPKTCDNFSAKPRPTTPKAKVVRPEQIRVAIFPKLPSNWANYQICSSPTKLTAGKARNVSSEQIRLLLERTARFAVPDSVPAEAISQIL